MGGVGGVGSLGLTVRSEESAELKGSGGEGWKEVSLPVLSITYSSAAVEQAGPGMLPSSWAPYSGPGYLGLDGAHNPPTCFKTSSESQTVLQLISYKHSRPPAAPGVKTPAADQGSTVACSHVGPQSARAGSARRSGTCQLSTRSREPSALDARPHCCRCVLGPCCNRLRRQPLLVPGRAGAWEHDDDHWKQGRWGSGGNGWQILFNGIWF